MGNGNVVRLHDLASGGEVELRGHGDLVWEVEFSPDRTRLATVCLDGTIKIWDVATGRERGTFFGHKKEVYSIAFSSDGNTLASGGMDNTIIIWRTTDDWAFGVVRRILLQRTYAVHVKMSRSIETCWEPTALAASPYRRALARARPAPRRGR